MLSACGAGNYSGGQVVVDCAGVAFFFSSLSAASMSSTTIIPVAYILIFPLVYAA
jgi:hypothetical protein